MTSALELKIPPVAVVATAAVGMRVVAGISTGGSFSIPGTAWWSAGIVSVGIVVAVLGVTEFHRAGTTVDPRLPGQSAHLVTGGVYRFSRNPMYIGFLLVLCGWGLFLGSVWALFFLPAFVIYMNRFQIIPEERFMHANFGTAYGHYSARVRRWI